MAERARRMQESNLLPPFVNACLALALAAFGIYVSDVLDATQSVRESLWQIASGILVFGVLLIVVWDHFRSYYVEVIAKFDLEQKSFWALGLTFSTSLAIMICMIMVARWPHLMPLFVLIPLVVLYLKMRNVASGMRRKALDTEKMPGARGVQWKDACTAMAELYDGFRSSMGERISLLLGSWLLACLMTLILTGGDALRCGTISQMVTAAEIPSSIVMVLLTIIVLWRMNTNGGKNKNLDTQSRALKLAEEALSPERQRRW